MEVLLIDDNPVEANFHSLAIVTLLRRHEFDHAVGVLVVVPNEELSYTLIGLLFGEWLAGVIRSILHRPEQRLRVRVVVADEQPGKRPEDAKLRQPTLQRGRTQVLPLSARRIRGGFRIMLICSLRQARRAA